MFELNDKVLIKSSGIIGTIVDISEINGKTIYIVENDKEGAAPGGYGKKWALFDCSAEDITRA